MPRAVALPRSEAPTRLPSLRAQDRSHIAGNPASVVSHLDVETNIFNVGTFFKKDIQLRAPFMDTRNTRLRAHQKNIDRYEGLLKTKLTEVERQFLEKRLSEERLAIAMLQFMSPSASKNNDASGEARE